MARSTIITRIYFRHESPLLKCMKFLYQEKHENNLERAIRQLLHKSCWSSQVQGSLCFSFVGYRSICSCQLLLQVPKVLLSPVIVLRVQSMHGITYRFIAGPRVVDVQFSTRCEDKTYCPLEKGVERASSKMVSWGRSNYSQRKDRRQSVLSWEVERSNPLWQGRCL